MIRLEADEVVLGSGFAGTLLALLLHRVGRRVVLLEQGRHPRFALGESSTPQANLTLEELARDYDLPWLAPLAEYGTWKAAYPLLPVGLKRGFTFAWHRVGEPFVPSPEHGNELLVAASPADAVGDTHWLRADFDHLLVQHAAASGLTYLDRTRCTHFDPGPPWLLRGEREGETVEVQASFVIDATGTGAALVRALGIDSSPEGMRTRSWSVFSHFADVALWADVQREAGADLSAHPFTCDDAALHHVMPDGWMWVLRFDNGITSAGLLLDPRLRPPQRGRSSSAEWDAVVSEYPSMARQFRDARPVLEWRQTGLLQRRVRQVVGPNWALLPSAAYTLDALYSTGNAHALLCVQRLARVIERSHGRGRAGLHAELQRYERIMQREIDFLDMLVHGSYRAFGCFGLLSAWTMYYFAGAIAAEHRRRGGLASEEMEILSSHDPAFRANVTRAYEEILRLRQPTAAEVLTFEQRVAEDIAEWNIAGLCDRRKRNMYPYA